MSSQYILFLTAVSFLTHSIQTHRQTKTWSNFWSSITIKRSLEFSK